MEMLLLIFKIKKSARLSIEGWPQFSEVSYLKKVGILPRWNTRLWHEEVSLERRVLLDKWKDGTYR